MNYIPEYVKSQWIENWETLILDSEKKNISTYGTFSKIIIRLIDGFQIKEITMIVFSILSSLMVLIDRIKPLV